MSTLRSVLSPVPPTSESPTVAVLLHGFGSHEHDLAGLAGWLPTGLPWASLRAPLEMGYGGAAWFPLSPDGGMDQAAIAAATDAVWAWVDAHLGADARIVPVGFSQGGLMALQLLRTRPARVLAPVVLAGFVPHEGQAADEVLAASRPAVFWGRGDADPVIWPDAIARTRGFLDSHATVEAHVYPGLGHSITEEEMEDVRTFLGAQLRG
ncbi:alpha/beta hydrolase [Demequina mangrovi]|uniref:Phospholipase/carboxylesterase n=1 Tax=Demequina mangrovi TaxID=1043493 RepID=A0A1H6TVL4_9MICO|nr:dienelactone hydrolase family protein [Demequina mangrovi]SEI84079.1 phospholipase/carboxylesterase [Demequina mangrovi]